MLKTDTLMIWPWQTLLHLSINAVLGNQKYNFLHTIKYDNGRVHNYFQKKIWTGCIDTIWKLTLWSHTKETSQNSHSFYLSLVLIVKIVLIQILKFQIKLITLCCKSSIFYASWCTCRLINGRNLHIHFFCFCSFLI